MFTFLENFMNRFAKFENNYQKALASINEYLQDKDIGELAKWLLETDANPYSFLPERWSNTLESAESFNNLLYCIHYNFIDDGDISFIKYKDSPRIVFLDSSDAKDPQKVLSYSEYSRCRRRNIEEYPIEVLDILPNDFGKIRDEYDFKFVKKCFITDFILIGRERCLEEYSKSYPRSFDRSWAEQYSETNLEEI